MSFFTETSIFEDIQRQEDIVNNSVDFYGIFGVIYNLLNKLGNLNTDQADPTKLNFKFAYPDKIFEDETQNAVIFDIVERTRLTYDTSAGKISQEKPRELTEKYDPTSGAVRRFCSYSYSNIISLDVYSTSFERLFQIVQYLETLFTSYSGNLQKNFTKVLYLGTFTKNSTAHNLFKNRMFNKTINLQIITENTFELLFEEIQSVTQSKINPNLK